MVDGVVQGNAHTAFAAFEKLTQLHVEALPVTRHPSAARSEHNCASAMLEQPRRHVQAEAAQTACNQYAGVAESGGGLRGGAGKPGVLAKTRQARLSVARRKFGLARQREQCELSGELPSGARVAAAGLNISHEQPHGRMLHNNDSGEPKDPRVRDARHRCR